MALSLNENAAAFHLTLKNPEVTFEYESNFRILFFISKHVELMDKFLDKDGTRAVMFFLQESEPPGIGKSMYSFYFQNQSEQNGDGFCFKKQI